MTVLQGIEPTTIEIAQALRSLKTLPASQRLRYVYALGGLQSVIEDIAVRHSPCTITDCIACWDLRQARAMFLALDLLRPTGTRPIFGGTT